MIAGRYALEREIGRGGTGVVWLGRDEVLGRHVALKRIGLLPGADSTDLARAEREAQLSARLNHPQVVAVFDIVVDADAHWLVMEYVEGSTLGQLVRERGPLPPDEVAPLLAQAADALAAAHAAGIVHRDVKPSNILVDAAQQVKLTDFGIARVTTDVTLTQTGMVTGSPAYLAPEVATGSRGEASSDVWSLGATLFHLLAGRPPYDVDGNVLGALYRIVNEEPPRLADAGWMSPLLAGTMERDPERRWSMAQVRDFLSDPRHRQLPVAAPVIPPLPPAPQPTVAWSPTAAPDPEGTEVLAPVARDRRPRRTPLLLAGAGLVVVLLLAGILYAVLGSNGTPASTAGRSTSSKSATSTGASKPTAAGMEAFIRDYVTTVADDPHTSWTMLTPKFQRESGGFGHYQKFWDRATNGTVESISADPKSLVVSYQVHFDDFDNGPGPTVLQLVYQDGTYKIDGETTKGFVPAG